MSGPWRGGYCHGSARLSHHPITAHTITWILITHTWPKSALTSACPYKHTPHTTQCPVSFAQSGLCKNLIFCAPFLHLSAPSSPSVWLHRILWWGVCYHSVQASNHPISSCKIKYSHYYPANSSIELFTHQPSPVLHQMPLINLRIFSNPLCESPSITHIKKYILKPIFWKLTLKIDTQHIKICYGMAHDFIRILFNVYYLFLPFYAFILDRTVSKVRERGDGIGKATWIGARTLDARRSMAFPSWGYRCWRYITFLKIHLDMTVKKIWQYTLKKNWCYISLKVIFFGS